MTEKATQIFLLLIYLLLFCGVGDSFADSGCEGHFKMCLARAKSERTSNLKITKCNTEDCDTLEDFRKEAEDLCALRKKICSKGQRTQSHAKLAW